MAMFLTISLKADCVQADKEVFIASKTVKDLYNFTLIEYAQLCEVKNFHQINACSFSNKKIDSLTKHTNKLAKLIDITYLKGVEVYKKCRMTNGFKEIDKIRSFDYPVLIENINSCLKYIKNEREIHCPSLNH